MTFSSSFCRAVEISLNIYKGNAFTNKIKGDAEEF
jgi:hypothetical protein